MGRPSLDALSQPRLIFELKAAIDRARFATPHSADEATAANRVLDLIRENETSAQRAHVLHNLGCRRRRYLRQLAAMLPAGHWKDVLDRMECGSFR